MTVSPNTVAVHRPAFLLIALSLHSRVAEAIYSSKPDSETLGIWKSTTVVNEIEM